MSAQVCERDGCEIEVTGRSKRCTEHQAEHRREVESARKRQARNADRCGQAASAFAAVSPDDADREAKVRTAMERHGLPDDFLDRIKTDPGAPFEHAAELAKMCREAPPDWARVKDALKKEAKVSIGDLERAMGTGEGGDGKQGRPVEWNDPEPWPKAVDGAELLDALAALLKHYVSLPNGGAAVVALWALYTWCFRAFPVSPYLMVTAPERGAGKSRVTELLSYMVQRPKPVSDASVAALFRQIKSDGPTLLFDEAQAFLNRRPDDPTGGILRAGFTRRLANVDRMVGEGASLEVRSFSTFCPKAMNGRKLTKSDEMLTDRSVVLPMTRATRAYPHLRADRDPVGEDVRRRCARWRDDHLSELREADPDVGARINHLADIWRPLFAIADAAGGEWPEKAWAAADALTAVAGTFDSKETLGTMLLADVRTVFEAKGNPERIKSDDLDKALCALLERPWLSMPKTAKPITREARGRMLRDYGVNTKTLRFDDDRDAKGYLRAAFEGAWSSWLPEGGGNQPVDPLTCLETRDSGDPQPVDGDRGVNGSESAETPAKQGVPTGQRVGNRGSRREGAPEPSRDPPALPSQPPGEPTAGDAYRSGKDGE